MSEPQRWVIPALLVAAVVGTPLAVWWERIRPSSFTQGPEHRKAMEVWRSMPATDQAAYDEAILDASEAAELAAGEAAERAVESAARTSALYR